MPTVVINDVALEAQLGERLLNVARRNGAHIGFVCDGNGICQTCQCRVLAGAEHLSPPNQAERTWLPDHRLRAGHRLACQTALRGPGPVQVLTTVEELRRQTLDVVAPPLGERPSDQLEPLLDNLVRLNVDQLVHFPLNVIATIARVGPLRFLFPWNDLSAWVDDGARVVDRMRDQPGRASAPLAAVPDAEARVLAAARALRAARARR